MGVKAHFWGRNLEKLRARKDKVLREDRSLRCAKEMVSLGARKSKSGNMWKQMTEIVNISGEEIVKLGTRKDKSGNMWKQITEIVNISGEEIVKLGTRKDKSGNMWKQG